MNKTVFQQYLGQKYFLFIWGVAGIVVFFAMISTIYTVLRPRDSLPQRPDIGGVVLTSRLLTTSEKLQSSLDAPLSGSAGKTTETYIGYMQRIESVCRGFQIYNTKSNGSSESDTMVYIKKSAAMCSRLRTMAAQSGTLYQATLPVMKIDPHIKRYQTLPLVWEVVRDNNLKAIGSIVNPVTKAAEAMEYPTEAAHLVTQLQASMKRSQRLSYAPALAQFQVSMLAERQRYWLSYNELQNLVSALKVQLRSYCTNLPSADAASLPECR